MEIWNNNFVYIQDYQTQTVALDECEIQSIPIIFINEEGAEISDFLTTPDTPVRIGNRNSERRSFIVSSTPFQKSEEVKIELLLQIEKKKELTKESKIKK